VPIVEPEILIDGDHNIVRFREVTERVVSETVAQLWRQVPCCLWELPAIVVRPDATLCTGSRQGSGLSAAHHHYTLCLPLFYYLIGNVRHSQCDKRLEAQVQSG
jgi:hypothetical protein